MISIELHSLLYDFTRFFIICLLSFTIIFFPVVKVTTVSGVSSTTSINSQFMVISFPFNHDTLLDPNILFHSFYSQKTGERLFHRSPAYCTTKNCYALWETLISDLAFQIHKFFQHGIRCRNNSRICLETTLCRNHIYKFIGKVYIGHL